ncbi:MAG: MotA/TolQ/ExbB proton channel family protein [Kiritimatiellae bacterium]|nr:MotA/TolQ/ExbB proton channel family protein [Kiritimatiellia bacterium]MBQ9344174.1 MotA/TolQ/ExbB proton channel family protein [Kiritimatiellia bacterium]
MWNVLLGGGVVVWVLVGIGLFGGIVFLERIFNLHRAQIDPDDFLKGVYTILGRGNLAEAASICEENPGPVARLALAAVMHHDEAMDRMEEAIEAAGLEEVARMERGLGVLATLARIMPMLGLLGTVVGLMKMLLVMRAQAPLVQSMDLAGGLWEALAATAVSLVLAVLLYGGYNFLVGRVESILLDMERAAGALLNFMRAWKTDPGTGLANATADDESAAAPGKSMPSGRTGE